MGLVIDIFFLGNVVDELKRVGFGKERVERKRRSDGRTGYKKLKLNLIFPLIEMDHVNLLIYSLVIIDNFKNSPVEILTVYG